MTHEEQRMTNNEELQLIRRIARGGHTHQFRHLANRYASQVLTMVRRLVPSQEEAEEVTQDVMVEAFKSLARYDERRSSFSTWLMSIAYHTALKHSRTKRRQVPLVEVEQDWLDAVADDDADAVLDDTDRVTLMEQAIGQLKPEDQMLLHLYYYDNQSIREIALITAHEESYLHSRLQWIRKKLAAIILNLESNERQ